MLVKRYFETTASDWEAIYRRQTLYATIYRERLQAALACVDELGLTRGAAVDIGCGPGLGSCELAHRGLWVHAIDSSAKAVRQTVSRARTLGLEFRVRGSISDVRDLPLPDDTFDLAFVVGVSEWLEDLERPLAEIARVLSPGGALILTADNRFALSSLFDPLHNPMVTPWKRALGVVRRRLSWHRSLRVFPRSRSNLVTALRRAGLTPTVTKTLGYGPFTLFNQSLLSEPLGELLHRRLSEWSRRIPLLDRAGLVHVLVARKSLG